MRSILGIYMSDRFYQQQYQVSCGALPQRRTASVVTKQDLLTNDCYKKLTKAELLLKLRKLESGTEMPVGRFKAPYLELTKQINPDIKWDKLTVKELQDVIRLNC